MDVSHQGETSGKDLMLTVASLTGLPIDLIQNEIKSIIEKNGFSAESLTLDELRQSLLTYLESFQFPSEEINIVYPEPVVAQKSSN